MRVIFAGGGTGGHINPAISIADYAASVDDSFEALFVGTRHGLETKLVPEAGYPIKYIDIVGFDRRNLLRNVSVLTKLIRAVGNCKKIINDFKPDLIILTGGYVSGPMAMAAHAKKVPALIHEQNVYPGLTVKGSERYVDYVAVSFYETTQYIKDQSKCVVTGNPIRPEILNANRDDARAKLGITKQTLLVFGGSLGAQNLNRNFIEILPRLIDEFDLHIIFGTGEKDYNNVIAQIKAKGIKLNSDIQVEKYINNMQDVMAASDIAITRSGAITVSELSALGIPAIFVPYPYAVRNHQEQNARAIELGGGATVLIEKELTPDTLYDIVSTLLNDKDKLSLMHTNQLKLAASDTLEKIYNLMLKMWK